MHLSDLAEDHAAAEQAAPLAALAGRGAMYDLPSASAMFFFPKYCSQR